MKVQRQVCMIAQKNDLNLLLNARGSLCSSIYLPVSSVSPQQNVVRARNLCRQAEETAARLTCTTEAHDLLNPLEHLLVPYVSGDVQAIPAGTRGLAGFTCARFQRVLPLPVEFAECVATGYHFYLRPLLPFYQEAEHFHILAVSQKQIRLLEADRFGVAEVHLEAIPLEVPDFTKELQFHLTAAATSPRIAWPPICETFTRPCAPSCAPRGGQWCLLPLNTSPRSTSL